MEIPKNVELYTFHTLSLSSTSYGSRTGLVEENQPAEPEELPTTALPKVRSIIVISVICGIFFFSSFCNGAMLVALPTIQTELKIEEGLLVWPTSSYYLTAGSCLLLAGSIADVVGAKRINVAGSLLGAIFAMACGLARTPGELIAFRALQGVANALSAPSAISIISNNLNEGRPRNMGFACIGFAQPLGVGFGLVLAGVLTTTVGWRLAFYIAAAASFVLLLVGIWALPQDTRPKYISSVWRRLCLEVDWVGLLLASTGLAMLSYVLATLSIEVNSIHKASSIALLIIAGISIPSFPGWMYCRTRKNKIALIPNSLWCSFAFTSSCIIVLLATALTNCMELYSSLFFQRIQGISALEASIRVLPSLITGAVTSTLIGVFVHRLPIFWIVLLSVLLSTVAPLLMSFVQPDQPYWENAFFAQILSPLACDLLSTVGLLIISDVFPKHRQALGGAVFNTCAQLGTALGLSITQAVASTVTSGSSHDSKSPSVALLEGYRAAFWVMFGWMIFASFVCAAGLRRVRRIGLA